MGSPLIRRMMSSLIAAISASPRSLRGVRIGQVGENPGRARRQQEQAVAKANCVVHVMGNQQRYHGTAVHQHGNLIAQAGGEGGIERGQRFVENEELRLDGERAGQRNAPGETER